MSKPLPVLVSPPSAAGCRRVRVDGQLLGWAYNVGEVAELLRRAGMDDADAFIVETAMFIDWRGGGPEIWCRPQDSEPTLPD